MFYQTLYIRNSNYNGSVLLSGQTPLHRAAGHDSSDVAELLLKYGAVVEATDAKGKMWLIE